MNLFKKVVKRRQLREQIRTKQNELMGVCLAAPMSTTGASDKYVLGRITELSDKIEQLSQELIKL